MILLFQKYVLNIVDGKDEDLRDRIRTCRKRNLVTTHVGFGMKKINQVIQNNLVNHPQCLLAT